MLVQPTQAALNLGVQVYLRTAYCYVYSNVLEIFHENYEEGESNTTSVFNLEVFPFC